MKRLLVVTLLAGTACAQTGSSAFANPAAAPPAPEIRPNPSSMTSMHGDHIIGLPDDLLPQPKGKVTLIGGTVSKLDRVRDQMTIDLFGGGRTHILFDARTRIYRDGTLASLGDLQNGSRVYVDTVLAGIDIFAQSIRVRTQDASGQSNGQVVSYDAGTGSLIVNDTMSPRQLRLHVLPTTVMSRDGHAASVSDLLPGTLVALTFLPATNGPPAARNISILAVPGNTFVFVGRVVQLDLHLGLVVVAGHDQKSYEITFDPRLTGVPDNLREGANVEVVTRFDGGRYMASNIKVDANPN